MELQGAGDIGTQLLALLVRPEATKLLRQEPGRATRRRRRRPKSTDFVRLQVRRSAVWRGGGRGGRGGGEGVMRLEKSLLLDKVRDRPPHPS